MYEHHEKPTVWRPRPNLSNPRSTNDIVWAFLRTNPTLLRIVTNRVLTVLYLVFIIVVFTLGSIATIVFISVNLYLKRQEKYISNEIYYNIKILNKF